MLHCLQPRRARHKVLRMCFRPALCAQDSLACKLDAAKQHSTLLKTRRETSKFHDDFGHRHGVFLLQWCIWDQYSAAHLFPGAWTIVPLGQPWPSNEPLPNIGSLVDNTCRPSRCITQHGALTCPADKFAHKTHLSNINHCANEKAMIVLALTHPHLKATNLCKLT